MHPSRTIGLVVCVLLTLASGVQAQRGRAVDLRYQWPIGATREYDVQTSTEIENSSGVFEVSLGMVVSESIEAGDGSRGAVVTRRVEELTLELNHPLIGNASFDSETGKQTGPAMLIDPFRSMIGRESVWTFDAEGDLIEAVGSLEASISDSGLVPAGVISPRPSADDRLDQARASLAIIPGKAVRRGETWQSSMTQVTPIGDVSMEQTHRLIRMDSRRNLAQLQTEGRFDPSDGLVALEGGTLSITTSFDPERGVVTNQRTQTSFDASVRAAGLPSETQQINQTAEWKLREDGRRRR